MSTRGRLPASDIVLTVTPCGGEATPSVEEAGIVHCQGIHEDASSIPLPRADQALPSHLAMLDHAAHQTAG